MGSDQRVLVLVGLSAVAPLTNAEIDAVSGGHGRGLGRTNITINIDPVIAIGDVIVKGNITNGPAEGNNASSSIIIDAGLHNNIPFPQRF